MQLFEFALTVLRIYCHFSLDVLVRKCLRLITSNGNHDEILKEAHLEISDWTKVKTAWQLALCPGSSYGSHSTPPDPIAAGNYCLVSRIVSVLS